MLSIAPPPPTGSPYIPNKDSRNGIIGRILKREIIATTRVYSGHRLKILFGGDGAYIYIPENHKSAAARSIRNAVIQLPHVADSLFLSRKHASAIRGFAMHEASHALHTDFDIFEANAKISKLVKTLTNIIEDIYIERAIIDIYPGSLEDLSACAEYCDAKYLKLYEKNPAIANDILGSAVMGIVWSYERDYGYTTSTPLQCLATFSPEITKLIDSWWKRCRFGNSTQEAAKWARIFAKEIEDMLALSASTSTGTPSQTNQTPPPNPQTGNTPAQSQSSNQPPQTSPQSPPQSQAQSQPQQAQPQSQNSPSSNAIPQQSGTGAQAQSNTTTAGTNETNASGQAGQTTGDADGSNQSYPQDPANQNNGSPSTQNPSANQPDDTDSSASNSPQSGSNSQTKNDPDDAGTNSGQSADTDGSDADPNTGGNQPTPSANANTPNSSNPNTQNTPTGPATGQDGSAATADDASTQTDPTAPAQTGGQPSPNEADKDPTLALSGHDLAQFLNGRSITDLFNDLGITLETGECVSNGMPVPDDKYQHIVITLQPMKPGQKLSDIIKFLSNDQKHGGFSETDDTVTSSRKGGPSMDALADPEGLTNYYNLRESFRNTTSNTSRALNRLIRTSQARTIQSGRSDGDLDTSALADIEIGNFDVFQKTSIARNIDTAFLILADCSGSMWGRHKASDKMPIEYCQEVTAVLTEALDNTPVKLQVVGFTDRYGDSETSDIPLDDETIAIGEALGVQMETSNLHLFMFKRFSESLRHARTAIGNMTKVPCSLTPTAEAHISAIEMLRQREEPRKVLMVITDGAPNDMEKAIETIQSAEKLGITAIGIGIGSAEHAPVEEIYRNHFNIENLDELAPALLRIVQSTLRLK